MTILPVLLDARPVYLRRPDAPLSLLLTPLGTGLLLDELCDALAGVNSQPPVIWTDFEPTPEYRAQIEAAAPRSEPVGPGPRTAELLRQCELSDWLLIVDPRSYPVRGLNLAALEGRGRRSLAGHHGGQARHLVAREPVRHGIKEYVHLDPEGRVRRVQRFYDGVTWFHTRAVAASLVPVTMLWEIVIPATPDLTALRRLLTARGFLSRDVGFAGGTFDLREEEGLRQLCEQHVRQVVTGVRPSDYDAPAPDIWCGPGSRVAPTARLHGPVIVQSGATIEPDVTIVGPALIGAGSCVQRRAVLAQCVVAPRATVPQGTTARQALLCGSEMGAAHRSCSAGSGAAEPQAESAATRPIPPLARELSPVEDMASPRCGPGRRRQRYMRIKRVCEGAVAAVALLVLSPLLLVTAVLVKLTSRGPVFFLHEREGRDGRVFRCCKFRTMVTGAHSMQRALYAQNQVDGPQFKLANDPRVTWLGAWLRTTNIDELPQLWNVVCGQMSLIGPRPSPFRENQICVPWRAARLSVRPGITGLWQICRHERSAGDFHQWIFYDILYVRHMSLLLDLKILLATLFTFGGRWSVPLQWMIPAQAWRDDHQAFLTKRPPRLEPLLPVKATYPDTASAGVSPA